jgi:hypothetical protein
MTHHKFEAKEMDIDVKVSNDLQAVIYAFKNKYDTCCSLHLYMLYYELVCFQFEIKYPVYSQTQAFEKNSNTMFEYMEGVDINRSEVILKQIVRIWDSLDGKLDDYKCLLHGSISIHKPAKKSNLQVINNTG